MSVKMFERKSRLSRATVICQLVLMAMYPVVSVTPAMAQSPPPCRNASGAVVPCEGPGGTRYNGTRTQPSYIRPDSIAAAGVPQNFFPTVSGPGFLFEPESPFASLKQVPTWNEIEQLLDNPYVTAACSSLAGQPALVRGTPGNYDGYPSYCTGTGFVRRETFLPGAVAGTYAPLPPLNVHPLNYNPATGEEMRLLNSAYPGGQFRIPDQLYQDLTGDPTGNTWRWTTKNIQVSPGSGRVFGPEVDYNGPIGPDPQGCIATVELVPPEGTNLCGGDPGEPGYAGFGVFSNNAYSTPAIRGVANEGTVISSPGTGTHRLYDSTRGFINARNPVSGVGGLNKPSLRSAPACDPATTSCGTDPNYLVNVDPGNTLPSNENDYIGLYPSNGVNPNNYRARKDAARHNAQVLGKSLFWDMQVGSDSVQSCGTCHFNGTGTDTRTKNQMNPNHLGGDLTFQLMQPNQRDLVAADFPLHKLKDTFIAGDPACTKPIVANVANVTLLGTLEHPVNGDVTVCDAANIVSDVNDVVSSMGVHWGRFKDIAPIGTFTVAANGVASAAPDLRTTATDCGADATCLAGISDPIPGFGGLSGTGELGVLNQFRRVEPRNTPTMQLAGSNFDNFWDGRARHDANGGSVFGPADPQAHVWVTSNAPNTTTGALTATRQIIKFSAIASLATGPGLSEFEMSFFGRNWAKVGKKLMQAGATPLANQLVDPTDSLLGPYSNQGGSACGTLAAADRSGSWAASGVAGKPGLCISYPGLIRQAFYPALWQNTGSHLVGCYTDGRPEHPNQCAAGTVHVSQLVNGAVTDTAVDPFDGYVLQGPVAGAAVATDTNQFTQMEANFSLFWGLAINAWVNTLVPDNTPFDQFLDSNPDLFLAMGDTSEALLVNDLLNCTTPGQRNAPRTTPANNPNNDPGLAMGACFTEVGNFKRDNNVVAHINATGENGAGAISVPAGGSRTPGSNQPDPLLGLDVFFASNVSLKNPNFRSGRCGACHNMPNLTDNTMPFTFKAILPDFASEFAANNRGVELLVEPLGRFRLISGFLLESEIAENGQDAVERRFINQSIVPNPWNGIAYPDGVFSPNGLDGVPDRTNASGASDDWVGAGQAYIDNGVYNLGVRPIPEDIGRGGNDAFGWPLSLAALLMKNLGGVDYEPNVPPNPITGAPGRGSGNMSTFDPSLGPTGGLFEESAHDQQINPGGTDEAANPLLPPYLAPFAPGFLVGDTQPELDEPFAGINTLTDTAMLEGFGDVIGAINPMAAKNENFNLDEPELMGTWPVVNRVLSDGAFKAPQLRNVELTGPYFHNGGMLTLRQVVDFYVRGGDFPITNAQHRDFLLSNLNLEFQSNLNEAERVALVDFLLELTDERNRFDRAPFDHPEVIVPVDGQAPDNPGRAGMLALAAGGACTPAVAATATTPAIPASGLCFKSVPAVGAAGQATAEPAFLNVNRVRVSGPEALPGGSAACPALVPGTSQVVSHYCR